MIFATGSFKKQLESKSYLAVALPAGNLF